MDGGVLADLDILAHDEIPTGLDPDAVPEIAPGTHLNSSLSQDQSDVAHDQAASAKIKNVVASRVDVERQAVTDPDVLGEPERHRPAPASAGDYPDFGAPLNDRAMRRIHDEATTVRAELQPQTDDPEPELEPPLKRQQPSEHFDQSPHKRESNHRGVFSGDGRIST
jgi:hypothetical protein